jgi:hypothetical protein
MCVAGFSGRSLEEPRLLSEIITAAEAWGYRYDHEIEQQSSQWESPSLSLPEKGQMCLCQCEIQADCFSHHAWN